LFVALRNGGIYKTQTMEISMKALALVFMLSALSALANNSVVDVAKSFGSIMFSNNAKTIDVNASDVNVQIKSLVSEETQVAHISYTDASDHYYAEVQIEENELGEYYISSCSTPDYVVEWKNGKACRELY